jgi:uncharacterized FAD-dependent dehydrogenase
MKYAISRKYYSKKIVNNKSSTAKLRGIISRGLGAWGIWKNINSAAVLGCTCLVAWVHCHHGDLRSSPCTPCYPRRALY